MNYIKFKLAVQNFLFATWTLGGCQKSVSNANDTVVVPPTISSLKNKTTTFFVGVATSTPKIAISNYTQLIEREFESITAEYQMKMDVILPTKGIYNWSKADEIVNYSITKGLRVHGHALIWHESTPDWLVDYKGTDAEFELEVKNYITTVVTRYKDKVTSWDVVNEGVADAGGALRNTIFKQRMGDDYMVKCFKWAREADPNCKLFYNDYGFETNISKQNKIFDLILDWKSRNIPINGLGFQMHINYLTAKSQMQDAITKAVGTGLLIHISELDIRMNPNNDISSFTTERATAQQLKYKEVVSMYNAIPLANKFGITLWGVKDDDSWLLKHHNNYNEWPLLFDSTFKAKKAHTGFLEGIN